MLVILIRPPLNDIPSFSLSPTYFSTLTVGRYNGHCFLLVRSQLLYLPCLLVYLVTVGCAASFLMSAIKFGWYNSLLLRITVILHGASEYFVLIINIATVRAWKIRRADHVARIIGVTVTYKCVILLFWREDASMDAWITRQDFFNIGLNLRETSEHEDTE